MAGILYPERDVYWDTVRDASRAAYQRLMGSGSGRAITRSSGIKYRRVGKKKRLRAVPEIKYLDFTQASVAIGVGGSVSNINTIAEGTEYNTRVGRRIYGKYVILDFICQSPTNAGIQDSGFIAIVQDKQANGTAANFTDIFSTASPMANKNVAVNSSRFKVLRRFELPVMDNTAGPNGVHMRCYLKLKNMPIQYSGAGATVPISNAVYLTFISLANTANAATAYAITYNVRFAFCDY